MVPVNTCADLPWTEALPAEFSAMLCGDPAWDRDEALRLVAHLSTAFLLDTLNDDERARAALSPEEVSQSGIDYAVSH